MNENNKCPYIKDALILYLETTFSSDKVLYDERIKTSDEKIGYMKGVNCIIEHLKMQQQEQQDVSI